MEEVVTLQNIVDYAIQIAESNTQKDTFDGTIATVVKELKQQILAQHRQTQNGGDTEILLRIAQTTVPNTLTSVLSQKTCAKNWVAHLCQSVCVPCLQVFQNRGRELQRRRRAKRKQNSRIVPVRDDLVVVV